MWGMAVHRRSDVKVDTGHDVIPTYYKRYGATPTSRIMSSGSSCGAQRLFKVC